MNSQQRKFFIIFGIFELAIFFINFYIITDIFERTSDLDENVITALSVIWGLFSSLVPAISAYIIIHYIHSEDEEEKKGIKKILFIIIPVYLSMLLGECVLFYDLVYEDSGGLYGSSSGLDMKASVYSFVFGIGHYLLTAFIIFIFYHEVWGYISATKIKGRQEAHRNIEDALNNKNEDEVEVAKNDS